MSESDLSPQVSAVILNWNGGEMVCNTVASVFDLTPPVPNVIVVDNASTDGSDVAIRRRFGLYYLGPDPKVVRDEWANRNNSVGI